MREQELRHRCTYFQWSRPRQTMAKASSLCHDHPWLVIRLGVKLDEFTFCLVWNRCSYIVAIAVIGPTTLQVASKGPFCGYYATPFSSLISSHPF